MDQRCGSKVYQETRPAYRPGTRTEWDEDGRVSRHPLGPFRVEPSFGVVDMGILTPQCRVSVHQEGKVGERRRGWEAQWSLWVGWIGRGK